LASSRSAYAEASRGQARLIYPSVPPLNTGSIGPPKKRRRRMLLDRSLVPEAAAAAWAGTHTHHDQTAENSA
jgi:hypothetical protein